MALGVPADFECAWRFAAYDFGRQLLPRLDSFAELAEALELEKCSSSWGMVSNEASRSESKPAAEWPADAVWVGIGESVQAACDAAAATTSKTVVVAAGRHELALPLELTAEHSGLRVVGVDGASLSGGIELGGLDWNEVETGVWGTKVDLAAHNLTEVPGLVVDGARRTVARYPNLPGGIEETCYYGCEVSSNEATWAPPLDKGDPAFYASNVTRNDSADGYFQEYRIGVGGACSIFSPASSYWCSENPQGGGAFRFRLPSGIALPEGFGNSPYAKPPEFHAYRPGRWANWMFEATQVGPNNYTFTRGGFQGARGNDKGGDFHVQNVKEELDVEGEFYFDDDDDTLYLVSETEPPTANVVVPKLRVLVNATGTQWEPVRDVALENLGFVATRHTYLDAHGVPSGGDWALERQGAVLVQGAVNFTVASCSFDRLDGNALVVSGFNRDFGVLDSNFSYLGGTAVAIWGFTNETQSDPARPGIELRGAPESGYDATDGEHPVGTRVEGCFGKAIGLYAKQSAFVFQAKAQGSIIRRNVFFNAPRAGINLNDGLGGGDLVDSNLVFNVVRETQDHGVLNSWDRQPFLTDNGAYMIPRNITRNFFVNNYNPQECVDNDDGSAYYETSFNFFVYGNTGLKSDFGGHSNHHHDNVYAFVGAAVRVNVTLSGYEDRFERNRVVLSAVDVGHPQCTDVPTILANNQYFTFNGSLTECGHDLATWQSFSTSNDPNSTVATYPDSDTIIQWARDLLGF